MRPGRSGAVGLARRRHRHIGPRFGADVDIAVVDIAVVDIAVVDIAVVDDHASESTDRGAWRARRRPGGAGGLGGSAGLRTADTGGTPGR